MLLFPPPPHLALALGGTTAPRAARRAVAKLVHADIDATDEIDDATENVLLMVSELVTNAVRAAGECSVAGWFVAEEGAVRVEIGDTSPAMPRVMPPDATRVGGHGLRIVANLSDRWGVTPHDSSKVVWFEARLTPRTDG